MVNLADQIAFEPVETKAVARKASELVEQAVEQQTLGLRPV